MRVLVLGGDGYLGWPTALHLSDRGHDTAVLDNFARRRYDEAENRGGNLEAVGRERAEPTQRPSSQKRAREEREIEERRHDAPPVTRLTGKRQ